MGVIVGHTIAFDIIVTDITTDTVKISLVSGGNKGAMPAGSATPSLSKSIIAQAVALHAHKQH